MRSLTILLCILAFTPACSSSPQPPEAPQAPQAPQGLLIDVEQLERQLGEPDLVLVHVAGDDQTYREGHIPSARWADWGRLNQKRGGVGMMMPPVDDIVEIVRGLGITNQSRIVIYDEVGGLQAARLFVALDVVGMGERAMLLDGHLAAWKAAGKPLATDPPQVRASGFTPAAYEEAVYIDHWSMRNRVWLQQHDAGGEEKVWLVDARPPGEYSGEEPGTDIDRPGHIPGAVNIHWEEHLRGGEDQRLAHRRTLRAMYERAGLRRDSLPIVYCRTGNQSSHTYFVLRYLGWTPRSYDGSFMQWQLDPEAPVAR